MSAFGLVIQNNTGVTINQVDLSYDVEQWRLGRSGATPAADTLTFTYTVGTSTDIATGSYTAVPTFNAVTLVTTGTVGALDGNANAYSLQTALNLTWNAGEYLVLRWTDINETGNDHGLAIDNFTLSTAIAPIPEPSTYAVIFGALAGAFVLIQRRRRHAR